MAIKNHTDRFATLFAIIIRQRLENIKVAITIMKIVVLSHANKKGDNNDGLFV